jgi:hypothetical protein
MLELEMSISEADGEDADGQMERGESKGRIAFVRFPPVLVERQGTGNA